jgi:hypothetical protein
MELSLKMHETRMIIEQQYDDIIIDEMFNMFNALLISATFTQTQIDNYIIDKANELNEDIEEDLIFTAE